MMRLTSLIGAWLLCSVAAYGQILGGGIIAGGSSYRSIILDGESQYLDYAGAALNPGTGGFAICCKFRLDAEPGTNCTIYSSGTRSEVTDYIWIYRHLTDNRLYIEFCDSSGSVTAISTNAVAVGQKYTLVVNADRAGNLTAYVDGSATGWGSVSIAAKSASVDPDNAVWGRYAAAAASFWPGSIDNAFYVGRTLTAPEIAWLQNGGTWRNWGEFGEAGTDGENLTSAIIQPFLNFDDPLSLGADATGNGITFTARGDPMQGGRL